MFRFFLTLFILSSLPSLAVARARHEDKLASLEIVETTKITLDDYPGAWNPSIVQTNEGYLLTFRVAGGRGCENHSYIGVALLNDALEPVTKPQLLDGRVVGTSPHQSEDARIFAWNERLFVVYNDNLETLAMTPDKRRDMYLAELLWQDGRYVLSTPKKLFHPLYYPTSMWQKNWVPFVSHDQLFLSYSLNPHEVVQPDLETGECPCVYKTETSIDWAWGKLRGGTPALLVDGQYLAFFHSMKVTKSMAAPEIPIYHYYMGAYTFSAEAPFQLTRISGAPIVGKYFYSPEPSSEPADKKTIYPAGYVDCGTHFLLAYGRDDREIWIGKVDKRQLYASLRRVESQSELKTTE